MSGGGSFSSDQTTLHRTAASSGINLRTGRIRVTSIQAAGIASASIILYDSDDASTPGTAVATYTYNTEGLDLYIPGAGILFKNGIVYNLTGASGSVTVTLTGG